MVEAKVLSKQKLSAELLKRCGIRLNRMVIEVNEAESSKRKAIISAAEDLEKEGFPIDGICYQITQYAADMNSSERYIRECLPSKFKNQDQRNRASGGTNAARMNISNYHSSGNDINDSSSVLEVKKKEDIDIVSIISKSKKQRFSESDSESDTESESALVKKWRKRYDDMKFNRDFLQDVVNKQTIKIKQQDADIADNYEAKYLQLENKNKLLELKNQRISYIEKQLFHIHDKPELSDEMVAYVIRDFVNKTWYPNYGAKIREEFTNEEKLKEEENLKSWTESQSES